MYLDDLKRDIERWFKQLEKAGEGARNKAETLTRLRGYKGYPPEETMSFENVNEQQFHAVFDGLDKDSDGKIGKDETYELLKIMLAD